MPRGGKRPGAGRPPAFNEQQMFAIVDQCERRLMKRHEQAPELQLKKLLRKRANHQYSIDRSPDSGNDRVHQDRAPGVHLTRLAQSLTDEQFESEYELHLKVPDEIRFLAKRDVERLISSGKINEEQREMQLRFALAYHLRPFKRAVCDIAAGQDVYVPDELEDAVYDAAEALKQRRRLLEDEEKLNTLPKGGGILRGRAARIPLRRLKAPKGGSVKESIIAEVARESRSLFGRRFSVRAVRDAWRAGNKVLNRIEAELRLTGPHADPDV